MNLKLTRQHRVLRNRFILIIFWINLFVGASSLCIFLFSIQKLEGF